MHSLHSIEKHYRMSISDWLLSASICDITLAPAKPLVYIIITPCLQQEVFSGCPAGCGGHWQRADQRVCHVLAPLISRWRHKLQSLLTQSPANTSAVDPGKFVAVIFHKKLCLKISPGKINPRNAHSVNVWAFYVQVPILPASFTVPRSIADALHTWGQISVAMKAKLWVPVHAHILSADQNLHFLWNATCPRAQKNVQ